jgi:hypothetical protein
VLYEVDLALLGVYLIADAKVEMLARVHLDIIVPDELLECFNVAFTAVMGVSLDQKRSFFIFVLHA